MRQRQIRVVWQWSIPKSRDEESFDGTSTTKVEWVDRPLKRKRFHSFPEAQRFIDWLMDTEAEDCPKLNGKWVDYGYGDTGYVGDPAPKPDFAYIETRLVEYPKWESK